MIAGCGLPTHLSALRPSAELAGAARSLGCNQGRRDPGAPARGRRPASTPPPPDDELGRPRRPQRAEQTAPHLVAPGSARLPANPAALAHPARRPPLDLPATTTRPSTHPTADPRADTPDGSREPRLGLPTHPRRAHRTRPPHRCLYRLEGPQRRRHGPRSAPVRTHLATI